MLNKIIFRGRIVKDCDLRIMPKGTPVAKFSVACERDYKNSDGERETDFFNCVWYGKVAEKLTQYLTKGRMIIVEGRLQIRKYQDKYYTEINVSGVDFCDGGEKKTNKQVTDTDCPWS